MNDAALLQLLRLASPALPVGAYAYSQGLEYAVAVRWVHDEASARSWITGLLEQALGRLDVPVLARFYRAWRAHDAQAVDDWNRYLHASRESAELQAQDQQLGAALARLLAGLDMPEAQTWVADAHATFAALYALAAARWHIPLRAAAAGYLWSWSENQVMAAIRLVPLGQTAGQRLLSAIVERIPGVLERGLALPDEEIGFLAPGLAIAGALHETQYSRLFRS